MPVTVNVFNSSSRKHLPKKKINDAVKRTLRHEKRKNAAVNIIFLDDKEIRLLNKKYLKHDYATDVLSFLFDKEKLEGEVYVGIGVAAEQAAEYKVSLTNELKRLAIHGTLHLLGYRDMKKQDKVEMTNLENKYIDEK